MMNHEVENDKKTRTQGSAMDIRVETKIDHNYHETRGKRVDAWEKALPKEYWDYRKRWNENPKNHVVEPFPIHLDIEATTNCNLKCTMCPRTELIADGRFWKVQNFDFELYKKIIDEGAKFGLSSIKFNFLGEPLLNPKIFEMVRYAKDKGVLDVMFNTNATLLTEEAGRKLIEAGLDKLFFSFDSPYREKYNAIRVKADFDKVIANIKRFNELREEYGTLKPHTRISMVRLKYNQQEWEDFQKLFEPLVDAVAWLDYYEHPNRKVIDDSENPLSKEGNTQSEAKPKASEEKFCCPQLWQRMFIHPDGVVTACCLDSIRSLNMGNIHEKSVNEIWNGKKYQKLRELHASGRIDEIPLCANCDFAKEEKKYFAQSIAATQEL